MHIVIIGNGVSGITAARFIRKLSGYKITIISAETDYFFSRTALMYIYMGHMSFKDTQPYEPDFWKKNKIDLRRGLVQKVDTDKQALIFESGDQLQYDKLIIATGSASNKFGWKGQDLDGVSGLYSYQDLEYIEAYSKGLKRAVIVGGGLIGIELAEMFHSRQIPVTMLVRETSFWDNVLPLEESDLVNREILANHIDLRLETELSEIVDDGNGRACAVITNKGERIDCGYVGLTAGVHPNIAFLKGSNIETKRGVVVNDFLETNVQNVYAIGDCAELATPEAGRRPIEAIWYTGKMMGETVAYTICGQPKKYRPRLWFNSAKFIDVEYQVYGTVIAPPPEHHGQIYWEHSTLRKSVRLVYDKTTGKILGFNLMGIRYRHEVCEKWILSGTPVETVLQNLGLANFDPEFYKTYESEIVQIYNQQTGRDLQLQQKRNATAAISFIPKLRERLDTALEKQRQPWYKQRAGQLTGLSAALLFLAVFLSYYIYDFMGMVFALPIITGLAYWFIRNIKQFNLTQS